MPKPISCAGGAEPGQQYQRQTLYAVEARETCTRPLPDLDGLGENIPMSTANLNDGFVALKDGQFVIIRIPYPMGFYAKGFDGRIDDPNAGWKGRGVWTTYGNRTPFHTETGKGTQPKVVKFQVRPDPLAR